MSTSKNDKIPPIPTGKHISSAKKESLSTLRRSNSASQLHNDHQQIEANLTEKNRIMATEVDRLKCLVQEKNNRILELDDENYQFRDYINRLELESSRLKTEYDDLKSENTQLKFEIEKLKHDYDELIESKNSTPSIVVENTEEQQEGMSRFFKYAERIFADVTKMMKYKKYINSNMLNLPSRPSILSTSLSNQTNLSNSFRGSTRSSRRSSLLIHENNRKSKDECLPVSLTTAIERDEIEEKSVCQEKTIEQDESMREQEEDDEEVEEEEIEEPDMIPDTQPSNSSEGLQAIEEESEYEEVEIEEEEEEDEEVSENEEEVEEETEEEEEEEEDEEEEVVEEETEEIIEVEETVEASEVDEDEEKEEESHIAQETIKNHTYLINETHQFGDKTFNIPVKTPEPQKRTVKFDCSLEEASFHTKYAKTPIRPHGKSVPQEDDSLIEQESAKAKKKSILKVRTSDPIQPPKNPEPLIIQANNKNLEKEPEQIQKSIFKTKRDTPTKKTNEVNQYLEDLVEQAAETDKENRKNSKKNVKETPGKGRGSKSKKYFDDSETASDSNDEDFKPKKNTKKKVEVKKSALPPRPEKNNQEKNSQEKSALPPLPGKKPKRPIESVYEPKQILKQTQNLTNRKNSVGSEKESNNDSVNSSANHLSPNINNLLAKKLRLSPDSEDSNDHSGYFPGETGSARRARKAVSYKEIPLNAKIRRDKDNKICVKNLKSNSANPNEDLVR